MIVLGNNDIDLNTLLDSSKGYIQSDGDWAFSSRSNANDSSKMFNHAIAFLYNKTSSTISIASKASKNVENDPIEVPPKSIVKIGSNLKSAVSTESWDKFYADTESLKLERFSPDNVSNFYQNIAQHSLYGKTVPVEILASLGIPHIPALPKSFQYCKSYAVPKIDGNDAIIEIVDYKHRVNSAEKVFVDIPNIGDIASVRFLFMSEPRQYVTIKNGNTIMNLRTTGRAYGDLISFNVRRIDVGNSMTKLSISMNSFQKSLGAEVQFRHLNTPYESLPQYVIVEFNPEDPMFDSTITFDDAIVQTSLYYVYFRRVFNDLYVPCTITVGPPLSYNIDVQSDIYLGAKTADFLPLVKANSLRYIIESCQPKLVYNKGELLRYLSDENLTNDDIDSVDFLRNSIFKSTSEITQADHPNAYSAITLAKAYAAAGNKVFCAVPAFPSNTDGILDNITWYLPTSTAVQDMICLASKVPDVNAIVLYTATEMIVYGENVCMKLLPPLSVTNDLTLKITGHIFLNRYSDDIDPFLIANGEVDPTVLKVTSGIVLRNYTNANGQTEVSKVHLSRSSYSAISVSGACESVGFAGANCEILNDKGTHFVEFTRMTQAFGNLPVVGSDFVQVAISKFSSDSVTTKTGQLTTFTSIADYIGSVNVTLASDFTLVSPQTSTTLMQTIANGHHWVLKQPTRTNTGAVTGDQPITVLSSQTNMTLNTDNSIHFFGPVSRQGTTLQAAYPNAQVLSARVGLTTKYFVTDYMLDDSTHSIECYSSFVNQPFYPYKTTISFLVTYGQFFVNTFISQIAGMENWPLQSGERKLKITGSRSEILPKPRRRPRR